MQEKFEETRFGKVYLADVDRVREELEQQKKEIDRLLDNAEFVMFHWGKKLAYGVGDFLTEVCFFFDDCKRCPVIRICEFGKNGCDEIYGCETCPRLRKCLEVGKFKLAKP
jgi:hypothetical protein